jgi:hypothetical protein
MLTPAFMSQLTKFSLPLQAEEVVTPPTALYSLVLQQPTTVSAAAQFTSQHIPATPVQHSCTNTWQPKKLFTHRCCLTAALPDTLKLACTRSWYRRLIEPIWRAYVSAEESAVLDGDECLELGRLCHGQPPNALSSSSSSSACSPPTLTFFTSASFSRCSCVCTAQVFLFCNASHASRPNSIDTQATDKMT